MRLTEAAELIGRSRQTLTNWIENGVLPAKKINGTYYVSKEAVESMLSELNDLDSARVNIEALRDDYFKQRNEYYKLMQESRLEHNMNRYLSICINSGVRTNFFGCMISLMVENGDLREKEAAILTELINGSTYEELKERYHTSRETIRNISEKAIRKSRNLVNIKKKLESVKSLQDEIEGLRCDIQVLKRYIGKQSLAEEEVALSEDEKRLVRMDSVVLNAILSKPIVNEALSVRAINTLYCYKDKRGMYSIKTLGDLCRITRLDYMAQRNAGKKTADEIEALLKAYDLNWGIDVEKVLRIRI